MNKSKIFKLLVSLSKNLILFIFLLLSCNNINASVIVSGGTDNDIIGRMCRMPSGRIAAIIERNPDWVSGDLLITFSDDGGLTWSTPLPVLSDVANQSTFTLLFHNDSLHLYYASNESGYYAIYHIASADGYIWNQKVKSDLGWNLTDNYYDPTVIVGVSGNFVMIYLKSGGGIFVAQSNDGYVWDQNKFMVNSSGFRPRICRNNNTFLAVWHQNVSGNYDIYCKSTTDLINWNTSSKLTFNGNSHDPYCAWNGVKYMVFYSKNIGGIYQLYYRTSSDLISWENEENYDVPSATNDTQSCLFFENSYLYLMWTHAIDYNTNNDIMFEKIQDVWLDVKNFKISSSNVHYISESSSLYFENLTGEEADILIYDMTGRMLSLENIYISMSYQNLQIRKQKPCIIKVITKKKIYSFIGL